MLIINTKTLKRLTGTPLKGMKLTIGLTVLDAFLASAPFGFLYYILTDMISNAPDVMYQYSLAAGCAVMMVIRAFLARIIHLKINMIGFNAGRQIRERLGNHLRKMPLGFFQKADFGSVNNSLLKDIDLIERIFSHLYAPMIATVFILIFFAVGLTLKDWRMGIAMLSTLPLASVAYWLTRNYARKWQGYMQQLMHQLNDAVMEYVDGLKELKSHRMIGSMFQRLDTVLIQTRQKAMKAEVAAVWPVYSFNFLVELGFIVLLIAVTWAWLGHSLGLAEVLLFLIAATRFFRPLLSMSMFLAELNYLNLAVRRVDKLMGLPELSSGGRKPALNNMTIKLENVTFGYVDDKPVFRGFDLTIEHGKVTALVGPSGSGKSTVAALIARFWELSQGRITVGEGQEKIDLSDIDEEYWHQHVSVVFQSSYLFNDTIENNLRVAKPEATDEELWDVLKSARLDSRVKTMEKGLETEVGAGGIHLSGGEQQRLAIARAMLKDAPFVILDEATASLDPENEFDIQMAMQELIKGKTVLVIAHKLSTIQNADHIVVLDEGKLVEQGRHDTLLKVHSLYHELWYLQERSQSWVLSVE